MCEHLQAYVPPVSLLRRIREKLGTYEYVIVSCLGLIAITVGLVLTVQAHSHHLEFALAMTLLCVCVFSLLITSWLLWCRAEDRLQRSLDAGQQEGPDLNRAAGQHSMDTASPSL